MKRKTIVYFCQPYFLDSTLETLQCIKYDFDIHLIIEVSADSKSSTILDLSAIELIPGIHTIESILPVCQLAYFSNHFSALKSVRFMIFGGKRSISLASFLGSMDLSAYINALHPALIHFDTTSLRAIWCLPFLGKIKIVSTIHDPVPHKGEGSWKFHLTNCIYRKFTSSILLYSDFAVSLFKHNYPGFKNLYRISLLPYNFISQYVANPDADGKYILFFGRLSAYKGIDILLKAIPLVLNIYPDEQFVIAGKPESSDMCNIPHHQNVRFIPRHLELPELARLISEAKFIVCPYREATQSGVLMTAYALNKCVLASNVGAFPEYIKNNDNGMITDLTELSLSKGILSMIENRYYERLNLNITRSDFKYMEQNNRITLKHVYDNTTI